MPAIPRLRFVTSHPWDLSDRLIAAMAECPSVCEHLHLPVQSGDDAVLRRMGRQYTIDAYLRLVEKLRDAVPGISLTTDVIVGFCGETEAQFENTLALLRQVRFETVFAAAFSVRPGTPAARLTTTCRVPRRSAGCRPCSTSRRGSVCAANERWVGRTTEVLVDQVRPPASHEAGTGCRHAWPAAIANNKLVHFDGEPELVGRLVNVRIEHAGPYALSVPSPSNGLPPLLVIGGPTATGKTSLSLALAEAIAGAEIISADSRQVYRGMDIGTAKVTAAERRACRTTAWTWSIPTSHSRPPTSGATPSER